VFGKWHGLPARVIIPPNHVTPQPAPPSSENAQAQHRAMPHAFSLTPLRNKNFVPCIRRWFFANAHFTINLQPVTTIITKP